MPSPSLARLAPLFLLASCSSSSTPGGAAPAPANDAAAGRCLDTINRYRATLGLAAYERWSSDEACADGQATSDSISGSPHGAFGQCGELAQNECPGWPGPAASVVDGCLAQMWAEGPGAEFSTHGHYLNMSSTVYSKASCGFTTRADGSVWAVQDFRLARGSPRGASVGRADDAPPLSRRPTTRVRTERRGFPEGRRRW